MDTSDHNGSLELEVSNFGPIVEAKVDLRPFTLFVGPSNTGKSYLAILIYALHRFFSGTEDIALYRGRRGVVQFPFRERYLQRQTIPEDRIDILFDWAQRVFRETEESPDKFPDTLPENIAALIRPIFEAIGDSVASIEAEINRCFGIQSISKLIRNSGVKDTQIFLRRYVGTEYERAHPFVHQIDITRKKPARLSASIPAEQPIRNMKDIERWTWRIGRRVRFRTDEDEKKIWRLDLPETSLIRFSLLLSVPQAFLLITCRQTARV